MKTSSKLFAATLLLGLGHASQAQLNFPSSGTGTSANANMGLGLGSPLAYFHLAKPAALGTDELLQRFQISDCNKDFFDIRNGTTINSNFAPMLWGHKEYSISEALTLRGSSYSGDPGNILDPPGSMTPLMRFDVRLYHQSSFNAGGSFEPHMVISPFIPGPVEGRPLFDWSNNDAVKMRLSPAGNLGLGLGNSAMPLARIDITAAGNNNLTTSMHIRNSTGNTMFMVRDDRHVGVGNPNPTNWLDVAGDIVIGGLGSTTNRFLFHTRSWGAVAGDFLSITPQYPNASGDDWAHSLYIVPNKGVGIGTENIPAGSLFAVKGKMHAEEVVVKLYASWPDFVFDAKYKLTSLGDLERYIAANKHLPNIPSADEIAASGVCLGQMQGALLQKIEELSLYMISLNKANEALKAENEKLSRRVANIECTQQN